MRIPGQTFHGRAATGAAIVTVALLTSAMEPVHADVPRSQSYLNAAQKELKGGNLRAAEIQLRNAAQADPDNPTIRVELAEVYLRMAKFPAAEIEARTALQKGAPKERAEPILAQALLHQRRFDQLFKEVHPGNLSPPVEAEIRLQLGLAHLQLGEFAEAEPLLRDAENLAPRAAAPMLGVAELLVVKKDLKGASEKANAALAIQPKNVDALRLSGEILRLQGNLDGALDRFNEVLKSNPNNLATLVSRANLLIAKNDIEGAKKDVARMTALAPNNPYGPYLSAMLAVKARDFATADRLLQQVAGSMGAQASYLYFVAAVKFELHQYDSADAAARRYLARVPGSANGTRLLGLIALAQNRGNDAVQLLAPYVASHATDQFAISALGRAYMLTGKYDKAIDLYRGVAAAEPGNDRAQMQLAVTQLQLGDTSDAVRQLEAMVQSDSGEKTAGPLLVMIDLRQGRIADAAKVAEKLAASNPKNPVAQTVLAQVRFAEGNYPATEKILTDVTQMAPKFAEARRNLAGLYMTEGRPADAARVFKDLLAVQPDDEQALLDLAQIAIASDRDKEAEEYLSRAQKAHPSSTAPGFRLVQLYALRKNWPRATALGRELAAQFPDNGSVLDLLGQVTAASGDPAGGLKYLQELAQKYPKSSQLLGQIATLQAMQKDMTGARKTLVDAIALTPQNATFKQALVDIDFTTKGADAALATARSFASSAPALSAILEARVLTNAKRPAEALAVLEKAQQQHPTSTLLLRIAQANVQMGKSDTSIAALESWLKAHPDAADVQLELAVLYGNRDQRTKAQTLYEQVLAKTPTNAIAANNLALLYDEENDGRARQLAETAYRELPTAEIGDTLGWILLRAGDVDRAMYYLKKAGAAIPDDPTVQYHLAVGLDRTGDKKNAIAVLERAVKSDRSFETKPQALALLEKLKGG